MSNEFKERLKVKLSKAESPNDILKGLEKETKKNSTYKGSKLAQKPELMITEKEHEEIVNKTINRVIERI